MTNQAEALQTALTLVRGTQPGTNLAQGMDQARLMLQNQGRDVPKIMVVFSAREPDDAEEAINVAIAAKLSFIQVASVGVGQYNTDTLSAIATEDSMFVTANTFTDLTELDILSIICPGTH